MPADDRGSIKFIQQLNERDDLSGMVPLLPGVTPEGSTEIRAAIAQRLDHDSISPDNPVAPTTPVGMVRFAEFVAKKPLARTKGHIAILGYGPLVGQPLADQVLPEAGVDMDRVTVFKDRQQIEGSYDLLARGEFRWIFSAYPAAAKIAALGRRAILIDAGYAIGSDSQPHGNAHPDLLAQSARHRSIMATALGRSMVTSFRRGTGPVTIAEVFQRAAKYKLETAQQLAATALRN